MIGGMFILFLVLLLLNVPIAFSLGASSLFYLLTSNMNVAVLAQKFYAGIDSFTLLCIPGFMLAGALMNGGGITRRILNFCNAFLGHFTGSLALVNIVASMVFAGISGTAIADVCSLGSMLIPAMVEDGYDDDFSVAVTAASSVVGPIIPPSVPMVIAGSCVSISVGKMFQAGIIPGVLLGLALCVPTYIISVKRHYPRHERSSWKKRWEVTKDAIWALLMPIIILGGIFGGIFTPTEAAAVAVVYALIISLTVYRDMKLSELPQVFVEASVSTATIMMMVGLSKASSYVVVTSGLPQQLLDVFTSITSNRIVILLLLNLLFLIIGMLMEANAAIIMMTPILTPLLTAFNIDALQFGIVMSFNLCIGLVTPPVGLCLLICNQIAKTRLMKALKAMMPMLLISVIVLMLITYIPALTTWLPSMIKT